MFFYLSLLVFAFVASFSAIEILKPVAVKIGLTDKPTARKKHLGEIPLVGGIAVYLALFITGVVVLLFYPLETNKLFIYLLISLLIVITGALDDRFDLSVKIRLMIQIVIASIMMFFAGDAIFSLGDLFSFGEISLGYFAYPFTIFAVLGAINAYNMVDGIDGLIGGISATTFLTLTVLFLISGDEKAACFCVLWLAALIPYLFYNLQLTKFSNKKIFMGDAGSTFIGFTIVWLLAIGTQSDPLNNEITAFSPVVALWVIALPLMDMAGVMIRRIKRGYSPFPPDRDHLHHIFMRAGFPPMETLFIITLLSLMLNLIGVFTTIYAVPDWGQLLVFVILFYVYLHSTRHVWRLAKLLQRDKTKQK